MQNPTKQKLLWQKLTAWLACASVFVFVSLWCGGAQDSLAATSPVNTTLFPASYTTATGSSGQQPVSALATLDQSGTQNNWNKYVEFVSTQALYSGYRSYTVPAQVDIASISAIQIKTNYLGPKKATQRWSWSLYNWSTNQWEYVGDNSAAADWKWTTLNLSAAGTLANFVNAGTREVRLQLVSASKVDSCDLDYESVTITSGAAQPTPTAPPTSTPTPTPTATPAPPSGTWWKPAVGATFQYQLSSLPVDQTVNAQIFDIDVFDNEASVVASLHAKGKKVVAYISAGSYEDWRPDAKQFPAAALGKGLDGWPGEKWLDVRRIDLLGPIFTARLDLAKQKGFDAVDFDNVDGYSNDTGFPLKASDQLTFNRWLANEAHRRGLGAGLKNDLDQITDLVQNFDFAINEQCFQYNECTSLTPFITANKPVFNVEYKQSLSQFCGKAKTLKFTSMKKKLSLDAYREACP